MLDSHCHLSSPYFSKEQIDGILESLSNLKMKCISVAEVQRDFEEIIELGKYEQIIPYIGIHPVQRNEDGTSESVSWETFIKAEPAIIHNLKNKTVAGIGEIGLDYSPHILNGNIEFQKEEQIKVFRRQLELALEFDVFVNVHSRQAGHYAIQIIKEIGNKKVIMHAFDGKLKYINESIKDNLTWFYSIPGSVQRCEKTKKIALFIPIDNLLLESDAPALGPIKDVKSTPLDLIGTISFIAKLRNMKKSDLALQLNENNKSVLTH